MHECTSHQSDQPVLNTLHSFLRGVRGAGLVVLLDRLLTEACPCSGPECIHPSSAARSLNGPAGLRPQCALETLLILCFNVQIIRAFLQKSVSVVWTEPLQALSGDSKDPA